MISCLVQPPYLVKFTSHNLKVPAFIAVTSSLPCIVIPAVHGCHSKIIVATF